jgi:hypothetical protein
MNRVSLRPFVGAVGVCAALAFAIAGCGSNLPSGTTSSSSSSAGAARSYLPNIAEVEGAIQQSIQARIHVKMTVQCPTVVPEVTGETFTCLAFALKPKPRTLMFLATERGGTEVSYAETSR